MTARHSSATHEAIHSMHDAIAGMETWRISLRNPGADDATLNAIEAQRVIVRDAFEPIAVRLTEEVEEVTAHDMAEYRKLAKACREAIASRITGGPQPEIGILQDAITSFRAVEAGATAISYTL